jgi:hypothetical protein
VVSQTLKTSLTPAAFAAAIDRRIAAIARAHTVTMARITETWSFAISRFE